MAVGLIVGLGLIGATTIAATSVQHDASAQGEKTTSTHEMTLTDVAGTKVAINPHEKTVLHFLATSCAVCLPTETMLSHVVGLPNVQLISVDVDPQGDNATTIAQFSAAAKSNWPYVLETSSSLVNQFHVSELDTVVVLFHNRVIFDGVAPSLAQMKKVLT